MSERKDRWPYYVALGGVLPMVLLCYMLPEAFNRLYNYAAAMNPNLPSIAGGDALDMGLEHRGKGGVVVDADPLNTGALAFVGTDPNNGMPSLTVAGWTPKDGQVCNVTVSAGIECEDSTYLGSLYAGDD